MNKYESNLDKWKGLLLSNVVTPIGGLVLYGISLLPNSGAILLSFFDANGAQVSFFSEDCSPVKEKDCPLKPSLS